VQGRSARRRVSHSANGTRRGKLHILHVRVQPGSIPDQDEKPEEPEAHQSEMYSQCR